jgi:hypothetical protein
MGWVRIEGRGHSTIGGRSKFLADENIDVRVVAYLRKRKFNVKTVAESNLKHRDDADVLAFAWREDRILLTHDEGFLDEQRYPPNRNPGVIVLPGGSGQVWLLEIALKLILHVVGDTRDMWRETSVHIRNDFVVVVRLRDFESGARTTSRLKFNGRDWYEWIDD